jgi:hypothetical protein
MQWTGEHQLNIAGSIVNLGLFFYKAGGKVHNVVRIAYFYDRQRLVNLSQSLSFEEI